MQQATNKRIVATLILLFILVALSFAFTATVYFTQRGITKVYNIHRLEVKDKPKTKEKAVKYEET